MDSRFRGNDGYFAERALILLHFLFLPAALIADLYRCCRDCRVKPGSDDNTLMDQRGLDRAHAGKSRQRGPLYCFYF